MFVFILLLLCCSGFVNNRIIIIFPLGVTKSLEIVQKEIRQFVGPETYMVGHSIDSDLHALRLVYHRVIDTAHLYPHPKGYPYKRSLKNLCSTLLGKEVQEGTGTSGHDSLADAAHAMEVGVFFFQISSPFHSLCIWL